ncbi:hypothetical protein [Bilophila wadsworthia]|uniref:hypothetical protein n=1 Tax=Bilophila wadsworthia TaxID=35833 RepID=UPI003990E008
MKRSASSAATVPSPIAVVIWRYHGADVSHGERREGGPHVLIGADIALFHIDGPQEAVFGFWPMKQNTPSTVPRRRPPMLHP